MTEAEFKFTYAMCDLAIKHLADVKLAAWRRFFGMDKEMDKEVVEEAEDLIRSTADQHPDVEGHRPDVC